MTVSLIDSLLLGAGRSLVRPVMVVDTKAAINSACYRVRTGHPGLLERAIQLRHLGLVPLLAPRHVLEEVNEHLAARAREEGLDPDAVTQIWTQQLRPHIRVVDLAIRDHLDPRLRGVLADDPDDLPTAALALLVAPTVILSDDHDLVDHGFAGQTAWTQAAGDVLIVATADGQLVSGFAGVIWTTVGAGYGVAAAVRGGRRAPLLAVTVAVAVLAGTCLLIRRYPPGRVRSALKQGGAATAAIWQEVTSNQQRAAARLPWVEIPAGRSPTLEERSARILARVIGTLSADDLHEQLRRDLGDAAPPAATVRKTLADHPAFVQVDRGRWQLGEPWAPMPLA
jgi:predicted nucleic acid-binding protein